jgi:hypothetical protein
LQRAGWISSRVLDVGCGFGPQVGESDIEEAFGLRAGTRVDEPAWLARARRV